MALSVQQQLRYWGIAALVFLVALWYLGNIIMPFILGGAIAYCLDPVADFFERLGTNRVVATILSAACAILVFVVLALAVMPLIISQGRALIGITPQLLGDLQTFLGERFPQMMDEDSTIRQSLSQLTETLQSKGAALIESLVNSAFSVINVLVAAVIVPVVAFYMLLDWDHMVERVDELLPREHAPVIRQLARDIDRTLAAFIRGQGTVMMVQGTFYAVALALVGLQFGVVVGAIAGLLSFIPYVGALVGGTLAIGLAFFQFWGEWFWIVAVVVIFFFGQFVEGNILTPKLVGSSVGLHPVWLLFALSVFGTLFGFVGLLVAVPVTAALGVIIRYFVGRYFEGRLYRGPLGAEERSEPVEGDETDPTDDNDTPGQ